MNFGANATTFIIPGEVFPTKVRASAHGISAASGKAGGEHRIYKYIHKYIIL